MADKKGTNVNIYGKGKGGGGGAVYFFGFIGSVVYFIQAADGFWEGVLGVLQAIVWPAFLVYEAFRALLG